MCDEMECFLYDVFCVVKRVLELKFVVLGGGVVEVVLFIYLENYVISMGFWEQFVIVEFVRFLFVIFNILVVNVVQDFIDLVVKLRVFYNEV